MINIKEYFAQACSGYTDADAKTIGPILENLAEQGKSTASQIVEIAQDESSPIHKYFEWCDDIAAQNYREEQARHMARSILVKVADNEGVEREVRAFYSAKVVVSGESKQRPYVPIERVQEDRKLADQVMSEALSQLISWKKKYAAYRALFREFQQLDGIFYEIEQLTIN